MDAARSAGPELDPAALFGHRDELFKLCYRMTGSAADAEDLVQETFRRCLEKPPLDLTRDLRPWLVRVAINLSRDALRARKRRAYTGTWLPGPVELAFDEARAQQSGESRYSDMESVSFAFLIALEALTEKQRAVLLLRDVLDYSVEETATALAMSPANVKTTLHRARKQMEGYDAEAAAPNRARNDAIETTLKALCVHLLARNTPALEALLAHDVRAHNDSDGEFFAAQRPVRGRERVIKFHLRVMRRGRGRFSLRYLNGEPALVADIPSENPRIAERAVMRVTLDRAGLVTRIDTIVAREKLRAVRFDDLERPNLFSFLSALKAAVQQPSWKSWLPAAGAAALRTWRARFR